MIEVVTGFNEEVAAWAADQIGCRPFENATAIGVMENGEAIAGIVYTNFDPDAGVIELSAASTSPRWLTRKVLDLMFRYPFEQIGCQMVLLRVSEFNTRMIRIAERFGFESHRIPRLRGRNHDGIVFTLTDDQWRSNGYLRG